MNLSWNCFEWDGFKPQKRNILKPVSYINFSSYFEVLSRTLNLTEVEVQRSYSILKCILKYLFATLINI